MNLRDLAIKKGMIMKVVKKFGYSRKESAVALSICVSQLDKLIKSGALKTFNIGSRVIITAESLERLTKVGVVPYEKGA